jgi:hypothetical protein
MLMKNGIKIHEHVKVLQVAQKVIIIIKQLKIVFLQTKILIPSALRQDHIGMRSHFHVINAQIKNLFMMLLKEFAEFVVKGRFTNNILNSVFKNH